MSVSYSFTTTTDHIPVSDEWTCLDFTLSSMPTILTYIDVHASRGAPYFSFDTDNSLIISSDDGVSSVLYIDLQIESQFTMETQFKPYQLPATLADLNSHRFFIGAYDEQDNGGGVLFSRSGLALVAEVGASATPVPGSQHLFAEGDTYYTLRLVIDGVENTMNVYLTKTSDLPLTGHQLRYTTAAFVTPTGTLDTLRLDIRGQAANPTVGKFATLLMNCVEALIPNKRPIADPGADQSANIGATVTHDGRNSYDPEGEPLTYSWALKDAPEGSRFRSDGTGGSTSDDGDADGFTNIFNGGLDAFSADSMPLLQPNDHLRIDDTLYQVSTDRWTFDSVTSKWIRGGTWNDDELVITEDVLPDDLVDVTYRVLHTATYFSDVVAPYPFAIADITGLYTVQLTVNDGELDSLPVEGLLNVAQTAVPLGCIPDVSWIWNYLSDFWSMVEDKEVIETVWTGFAQAAANQLLTAWQIDYNKSLLSIQRVFQRRWLNYSTVLNDNPDTATIRIVRGPIFSTDLAAGVTFVAGTNDTLHLIRDAGDIEYITFDPGVTTVESIASQINAQLDTRGIELARVVTSGPAKYLVLEYATLLRIRPNGTANASLGFSTTAYTFNTLSGTAGGIAAPGETTSFVTTTSPPVLDFDEQGIGKDDVLIWGNTAYRVLHTALESGATRALTLVDALPDSLGPDRAPWSIASRVISTELDFSEALVVAGDAARFEVKNLSTSHITNIDCQILGAQGASLGFDPQPLLEFYAGVPSSYRTRFLGIRHLNNIPVDALVVEIPKLQHVIKDPTQWWTLNQHYTIDDQLGSNAVRFRTGTFSLASQPPDTLWAEVTYLDNRPDIEANFGKLVGLTLADLNSRTDDLDYLSAIRGLWWAYFGGPALNNVKTGAQILLGLPFSEAKGTIKSIEPNFSTAEGRIVIEDTAEPKTTRAYFYPTKAGLGVNPVTEAAYQVGETVEQFAPLSGGIEVLDYIEDPEWFLPYVSMGHMTEVEKYFKFLFRGDVDTFNLINLSFAIDFVRKIKPHYTYPIFVIKKDLTPTEINVDDDIEIQITRHFFDSFCHENWGSYIWDDFDGSGICKHHYDTESPPFVHDTHRLCPEEDVWIHRSYVAPGGTGWYYDSIWAYDDGGGADRVPLSGPDSSPPPPYGPLVGVIEYDATVTAGTYHRENTIG
jgi:hypothetical protein